MQITPTLLQILLWRIIFVSAALIRHPLEHGDIAIFVEESQDIAER